MVRGSPCMCMRHTAQPHAAAASTAPGPRSARTWLMKPARAAEAARMTSGLLVSTEMTAVVVARSRSMTGSTRCSSSSRLTGCAPGRVDSPPTSMSAAPSAAMRSPVSTAASTDAKRPPSEKESGVTLSTPITTGRVRSSVRSAQRRRTGGDGIGTRPRARWRRSCRGLVLSRRNPRRTGRRRRRRRLVGERIVPARGRLLRPARHDVLQLLLVDRLVLHERFGHEVQLVERGGEDLPGTLIVALDDPAHFLIDGVRGDVGHLLVLSHAAAEKDLAGLLGVGERTELVREAPLGDHVARELRRALDVVGSAGRHRLGAENELLGDAPAEERRDGAFQAT